MTRLVFVIGISFGLHLVSYPACVGKIIPPPEGNSFKFVRGSTGRIEWSFDDDPDDLISRAWHFKSSDGSKTELLASICDKNNPNVRSSSLPGIAIEKPATLLLKNVDLRYNGTYLFSLHAVRASGSEVTVYIADPFKTTTTAPTGTSNTPNIKNSTAGTKTDDNNGGDFSVDAIIGIVTGVLVLIAIIILCCCCRCCCCCKKRESSD